MGAHGHLALPGSGGSALPAFLEAKLKPAQIRTFRTRIVEGVIRVSDE